jgi:hypothetical protein
MSACLRLPLGLLALGLLACAPASGPPEVDAEATVAWRARLQQGVWHLHTPGPDGTAIIFLFGTAEVEQRPEGRRAPWLVEATGPDRLRLEVRQADGVHRSWWTWDPAARALRPDWMQGVRLVHAPTEAP